MAKVCNSTSMKRPEGKTLEFKRDLSAPDGVLRGIVAFANTAGGTLLIGAVSPQRWRGAYFTNDTVRRYGLSVLKPCGYFFLASASETDVGMMTSWPGFQFTGVATACFAFI